jgi:hypothetical protein
VATENRIRDGADAAMGYPRFGMLDLLKLLSGLLVGLFRSRAAREERGTSCSRSSLPEDALKLSLVTCPVAMLPATSEAEKVRFHTLNRATGNRVHARYVDVETGKPVDDEDQVKGYEREDGGYVMLEDEELDCQRRREIASAGRSKNTSRADPQSVQPTSAFQFDQ